MPGNVSIEISNFVTKGCLSTRKHAEEAPKICAAVDLTFRGHPPSIGGLLRSGRIALRSCRASISSMLRRRPDAPAAIAEAAFGVSWMRQKCQKEALVQPPMDLTFNIELRPGWRRR
jgi:hypothetical protein